MKPIDEQIALLMQGVEYGKPTETDIGRRRTDIREVMEGELRARLAEERPLRVYCGYDPTAPDLHLGHTVTMRKLRQFQDLGHEVTFLIGTFTGRIGDPSDKDDARRQQTPDEVARQAQTYADQVFRVLDRERTKVRYNADWLAKLTFEDVIHLASHFTVQQFLARDRFARRLDAGKPIWLHEFMYGLMQGYDAVAMQTDVQVGGTEQLFNLMAGRKLQEAFGQRPQIVLTMPILVGTDGHQRMSKSTGNYIGISEPPEVMYGKVMSLPDSAMLNFYTLVTRYGPEQIAAVERGLADGTLHPMEAKKQLAHEIVSAFYGDEAAQGAAAHFRRVFQAGRLPADMPVHSLDAQAINVVDLLVEAGLARSKSQARRLIQQGGVRLDGEQIKDITQTIAADGECVLQVGKRKFVRLVS
jgi:tyrosyl-tRNA synthetase